MERAEDRYLSWSAVRVPTLVGRIVRGWAFLAVATLGILGLGYAVRTAALADGTTERVLLIMGEIWAIFCMLTAIIGARDEDEAALLLSNLDDDELLLVCGSIQGKLGARLIREIASATGKRRFDNPLKR